MLRVLSVTFDPGPADLRGVNPDVSVYLSPQLERQQEQEDLRAPEFVKVKENLRRTSVQGKEEKEV